MGLGFMVEVSGCRSTGTPTTTATTTSTTTTLSTISATATIRGSSIVGTRTTVKHTAR